MKLRMKELVKGKRVANLLLGYLPTSPTLHLATARIISQIIATWVFFQIAVIHFQIQLLLARSGRGPVKNM